MEKLIPIVIGIFIGGIVSFIGGLFIVHLAINAEDIWKGIVGVFVICVGISLMVPVIVMRM